VKKYVIKDWKPVEIENIVCFDMTKLPRATNAVKIFRGISNYGDLCVLSEIEKKEVQELWKELAL
jgi:hypothetical protein